MRATPGRLPHADLSDVIVPVCCSTPTPTPRLLATLPDALVVKDRLPDLRAARPMTPDGNAADSRSRRNISRSTAWTASIYRMRRILAYALRVASVPVGVGVGLWMAVLTSLPYCPVRGLGTLALCAARSRFDPRLCVLCGAAAACLLLLISIAVRRRASRVGIFDVSAAAAGIVIGLWTSSITYGSPPCGPHQLCIGFLALRFEVWQSALIGAAAMMVILVAGAAANTDLRRVNLSAGRSVQRWLFKDLSSSTSMGGPDSDAG
jgi:hypothetical protein